MLLSQQEINFNKILGLFQTRLMMIHNDILPQHVLEKNYCATCEVVLFERKNISQRICSNTISLKINNSSI